MFLLTVAGAAALAAADLPYAGKWKMDPAKSDLGQITVTFADLGSGEMQFTMDGQSYKFKTDGKEYPALMGQTAVWKQVDANTWETVDKLKGKTISNDTTKLSADGKTLTYSSTMIKPEGGTVEETMVFERISGGQGLAGKWKTRNFKTSSPETLELAASGADGLKLTVPEMQMTCDSKFDGKDYPCAGATLAQGWTMSAKKNGPRSVEIVDKLNGKPLYQVTMTVSQDGKTLTETGNAVGVPEKFKVVYDRQ
jgi:hypothetical protein